MRQHPDVPGRTMDEDAVRLHELFLSLQAGGFTETQALYLVGHVMAGNRAALVEVRGLLDRD